MVNIDTVYQRVLALANKEQRGYITPQEFNLFANMAQLDIFEQYFYDLDQWRRRPGSDTVFGDMIQQLEKKIDIFLDVAGPAAINTVWGVAVFNPTVILIPDYVHNIERVEYAPDSATQPHQYCDRLNNKDFNEVAATIKPLPLCNPTPRSPVYNVRKSQLRIHDGAMVDPAIKNVAAFYIRKPLDVVWGHVVIRQGGGKALYNAATTTHFELHMSEETELVYKILKLAGSAIKRDDLMRGAVAEEAKLISQQKQ